MYIIPLLGFEAEPLPSASVGGESAFVGRILHPVGRVRTALAQAWEIAEVDEIDLVVREQEAVRLLGSWQRNHCRTP